MNKKIILIFLFLINLFAWNEVYNLNKLQPFRITYFDIGQGDSSFIETPRGYQILIDGGPTGSVLDKLGNTMDFWDKSIDVVVSTHPDHDHMAGLIEVLKKYKVDFVLWDGLLKNSGDFEEWERLLKRKDINSKVVFSGYKIKTPMAFFDILNPSESLYGKRMKNDNNGSIAVRAVFNKTSFLFMGDADSSIEEKLINEGRLIDSDVLMIAHHGSKYSSSEEFIQKVSPVVAVISVGENNLYGHPSPDVLGLLNKYDINTLRTDLIGDIKIISDGKNIKIN